MALTNYVGGLGSASAGCLGGNIATTAPRTISSAIGRVDGLNERLSDITGKLATLSDQIGGPRPIECTEAKGIAPPSNGAVGRLNDGVDRAHSQASDIDELLNSISRALG